MTISGRPRPGQRGRLRRGLRPGRGLAQRGDLEVLALEADVDRIRHRLRRLRHVHRRAVGGRRPGGWACCGSAGVGLGLRVRIALVGVVGLVAGRSPGWVVAAYRWPYGASYHWAVLRRSSPAAAARSPGWDRSPGWGRNPAAGAASPGCAIVALVGDRIALGGVGVPLAIVAVVALGLLRVGLVGVVARGLVGIVALAGIVLRGVGVPLAVGAVVALGLLRGVHGRGLLLRGQRLVTQVPPQLVPTSLLRGGKIPPRPLLFQEAKLPHRRTRVGHPSPRCGPGAGGLQPQRQSKKFP